ncbi:hypothetical protein [Streptomyces sp. NPDC002054]|uniref:hypothetical protein n=1 Tax=Streptomyces sp. NPDC002054 TaxID=3154663 RepID=UPI003323CFD0
MEADRGPWYRGRRAVAGAVAGVAAVALAAAGLAMAGQPGSDRPEAGGPVAGPSAAPAPGTGTGTGAGSGTGTPTSPASGSSPEPGNGTGTAPGPAPTPPGPGPTASAIPSTAPALRTAVRSHVWANGCDHAYLLRQGPEAVPPPPAEADAPAWATARQAVHAGQQIVEVTVHGIGIGKGAGAGAGAGAVVLQGLDIRVTARRTPPPWNVYLMSPGCGGSLTPAAFAVNLDAPRPLARPVTGHDGERPVPAPAFPLRVTAEEPVVLRIEASATGCDCDWYAELRWSGPAGSGVTRIDDNGRTLRTSAAPGRPQYGYASELGRWAKG